MGSHRILFGFFLLVATTCPLLAQPADNAYARWARSRFGEAVVADPAQKDSIWGEAADPDGDNLPNLVEYLSDTDPLVRTPASSSFVYSLTPSATPAGRRGQITAWQRTDDPDLHVIVQTSPDLLNWWPPAPIDFSQPTPMNAAVTTVETGAVSRGLRQMRYQDIVDAAASPSTFMRLFVVRGNARVAGPGLEPFSFTFNESVAPGAVVQSNTVIVQGFSGTLTISIPATNPQVLRIYVNGVLQLGTTAVVRAGDAVWLEATAPAGTAVTRNYTLTAGSYAATWRFTTASTGAVPDQPGVASGYTPVEAGVSETGAAQVSLPIFVSPGVAGMQPKLALTYSSQAGNGPYGLGFSLSGLSSISRVGRTIAHDTVKGGVEFNQNDRFALDGQRLRPVVGAEGADGTEYRSEFDPTTRVRCYGVDGSGPLRWVVETKAGLKMEYGTSPNTRIKPEGGIASVAWAVEKITDTAGNSITVEYDETARQRGEVQPLRIRYTSNEAAGLAPGMEVHFDTEDRDDQAPSYIAGTSPVVSLASAPVDLQAYSQNFGTVYTFSVTGVAGSGVIGTGIYAPASPVARAAVHAGIVAIGQTKLIGVRMLGQQQYFTGSTQNGITSTAFLSDLPASFSFVEPTLPGGFALRQKKRVTDIESRLLTNGVPTVVRHYKFGYEFDATLKVSRLVSVTETGPDGALLVPPTLFEWKTNAGISFAAPADTGVSSFHASYVEDLAGDFNGDGKTDLLNFNIPAQLYDLYLNQGNGTFSSPIRTPVKGLEAAIGTFTRAVVVDVNGDGKADVLSHDPGTGAYALYVSNGTNFGAGIQTAARPVGDSSDTTRPILLGDFNGDGRTDFLIWSKIVAESPNNNYYLYLSNGSTYVHFADPAAVIPSPAGEQQVGDFNGDGMTDVLSYDSTSGKYKYYRCVSGNFLPSVLTNVPWGGSTITPTIVGDFNGDGIDDLLIWNQPQAQRYNLYRGTGGGFALPVMPDLSSSNVQDVLRQALADFNGDGRADLLIWNQPFSNGQFNIYPATGAGFDPAIATGIVSRQYPPTRDKIVDLNGDGRSDILGWDTVTPQNGHYHSYLSSGPKPGMLSKVTNGHGGFTTFEYKPITDNSIFTKGTGSAYPCHDLQAPLYVVTTLSARNGIDGDGLNPPAPGASPALSTTTYKYEGAWMCLDGRGFQGFAAVEATSVNAGIVSRTEYETSSPLLAGRPKRVEQRLLVAPPGGSVLISESTTTYSLKTYANPSERPTYLVREASNVSKTYEVNRPAASALLRTTTRSGPASNGGNILYDDYANVRELTTTTTGAGEAFTENVVNTYADAPTPTRWHLGRLATSTVTKTAPDGVGGTTSSTRGSSFAYHPVSSLLTQEVIEPSGGTLRQQKDYVHDAVGNIATSTLITQGSAPRTTTTFYTTDGRFVSETRNALGHSETKEYDPLLGTVMAQTGPNGLRTEWDYDALGRPIVERRPDGTISRSFYRLVTAGTVGAPPRAVHYVRVQSTGGAPRTVWYDILDREIRSDAVGFDGGGGEVGASGTTVSVYKIYNARGEVVQVSQPYFAGQTPLYSVMVYDAVGRETLQTDPGARVTKTTYDGFTTTIERTAGTVGTSYFQKAQSVVNAMGWTIRASQYLDGVAKTVTRRYDAYGNLRFVTDPQNHVTELRYDIRGNKVWMSEPNAGISTFGYNGFSELISQQNSAGEVTTLAYDALGRVIERGEREGITAFTFDTSPRGIGLLAREEMRPPASADRGTQSDFSRSYFYDALSRPRSTVQQHGGDRFATSRGYDANGRPATMTFPTGFAVRQNYTALGYLRSVESTSGNTTYWTATLANARGQVERESLGNGIVTDRTFEPETGLIASVRSTVKESGGVQNLAFAFDLIGNLKSRRDQRLGSPFEETFTYDTLNRLKNVETTGALPVLAQYDDIGNLRARTDVGVFAYGNSAGPHALTAINNSPGGAFNKACTYDNKGNRITDGGTALTYASFNKPTRIKKGNDTLTFDYGSDRGVYRQTIFRIDAQGRETQNVRHYVGGMYEREIDSVGGVRHIHYIAGGSGVVAIKTDESNATAPFTGRVRYIHKDHLGSVDAITDEGGNVLERHSFDAWGRRRTLEYDGVGNWVVSYPSNPSASAGETHRGFTGHEMLDLVGLVHMGGRVYDPLTARFLSPDPFVQTPDNLQNLNRYSYVLNNPLSMTDPSGFFFKAIAKFFKKHWRTIATVAIGLALSFAVPGSWGILAQGFAVGFGSAFSGTLLAGGSIIDALRAGLQSGVLSAASAGALNRLSTEFHWSGKDFQQYSGSKFIGKLAEKTAAHGVIGGVGEVLNGGKFLHGFMSSGAAAAAAPSIYAGTHGISDALGVVASATVAGTVSQIGGGKFANGAIAGALAYVSNAMSAEDRLRGTENQHDFARTAQSLSNELCPSTQNDFLSQNPGANLRDDMFTAKAMCGSYFGCADTQLWVPNSASGLECAYDGKSGAYLPGIATYNLVNPTYAVPILATSGVNIFGYQIVSPGVLLRSNVPSIYRHQFIEDTPRKNGDYWRNR